VQILLQDSCIKASDGSEDVAASLRLRMPVPGQSQNREAPRCLRCPVLGADFCRKPLSLGCVTCATRLVLRFSPRGRGSSKRGVPGQKSAAQAEAAVNLVLAAVVLGEKKSGFKVVITRCGVRGVG
jgi:hypothetical protein